MCKLRNVQLQVIVNMIIYSINEGLLIDKKNEPEYNEKNLTYKQVENLIKEASRKLNKDNLIRIK